MQSLSGQHGQMALRFIVPMKLRYSHVALGVLALVLSGCATVLESLPPLPGGKEISSASQLRPSDKPQAPATDKMEASIHTQINQIRKTQGLEPLKANEKLARVAREYSRQMAAKNFFSHYGPAGDSVADRVRTVGVVYRLVGENLAKTVNAPKPDQVAVRGWMNSPGHRANVLRREFSESGIGVWRTGNTYYLTQVFLRPLF